MNEESGQQPTEQTQPVRKPLPCLHPTAEEGVYELHVDNSSKDVFETCARAAQYYMVLRRTRQGTQPALNFGDIIHKALVPRMEGDPLFEIKQQEIIVKAFAKRPNPHEDWRTADRALAAIEAYNGRWPIDQEPFQVLKGTVEMPFKIKLGEADLDTEVLIDIGFVFVKKVIVYWTGKIDGMVDWGVHLVMDHKTTSVLGEQFYKEFQLSSQMQGYVWAGRKLGFNPQGLLLDVLALRKPTRTGVPTEFQRQRYFYEEEHLDEWERDMFTLVTDFLEHLCRNYFPKSPKWCFGKYSQCQYWEVCTSRIDQRDNLLQEMYGPVTWSPLNADDDKTNRPRLAEGTATEPERVVIQPVAESNQPF
jgi:hypothetical protein